MHARHWFAVLPSLRHWAHDRLPRAARDVNETDDLVQLALMRALKHIGRFNNEGPGSFLAYLRQILLNQVRDEVRRLGRRPEASELDPELPDANLSSPLERLVGEQRLRVCENALAAPPRRRAAAAPAGPGRDATGVRYELPRNRGRGRQHARRRTRKDRALSRAARRGLKPHASDL